MNRKLQKFLTFLFMGMFFGSPVGYFSGNPMFGLMALLGLMMYISDELPREVSFVYMGVGIGAFIGAFMFTLYICIIPLFSGLWFGLKKYSANKNKA